MIATDDAYLSASAEPGTTAKAASPVPVRLNVGARLDPAVTMKAGVVPNGDHSETTSKTVSINANQSSFSDEDVNSSFHRGLLSRI